MRQTTNCCIQVLSYLTLLNRDRFSKVKSKCNSLVHKNCGENTLHAIKTALAGTPTGTTDHICNKSLLSLSWAMQNAVY